jgi:GNAT superfamily N-acetyltransferase
MILEDMFNVELIDFKAFKDEILNLRAYCWGIHHKDLITQEFYSKQDEIEDLASIHCGIIVNNQLIACHRLLLNESILDLPYSEHFSSPIQRGKYWYAYRYNRENDDFVVMRPPVASTGRLVIHPNYTKKGIPMLIIKFWIQTCKDMNVRTLLSYPSPWMVTTLLDLGFTYEKELIGVFKPLPKINLVLTMMKL